MSKHTLKFEVNFKLCMVAIYAVYVATWLTAPWLLNDNLLRDALKFKSRLEKRHYDIAIIGGSNAVTGISAHTIETNYNNQKKVINLAIAGNEGVDSLNYESWLAQRTEGAETVIYSTMNFWMLGENAPFARKYDGEFNIIKSNTHTPPPSISALKNIATRSNEFDSWGDVKDITCDNEIAPFPTNNLNDESISEAHVKDLSIKIKAIKDGFNARKIYLRIPPVFIKKSDQLVFDAYLSKSKELLSAAGVEFLGADAYTSDKSVMCFGPNHPTLAARSGLSESLGELLILKESGSTTLTAR